MKNIIFKVILIKITFIFNQSVSKNNTNDFLMVDNNLFTESEEIQSQNYFENNLSEDDEDDEKEEVFHEEVIWIKIYKNAFIEIKKTVW